MSLKTSGFSSQRTSYLERLWSALLSKNSKKLLLKYFVAEDITGVVDENEIARTDEELKEKIWEELKLPIIDKNSKHLLLWIRYISI